MGQRGVHVEVERVAELVGLAHRFGLDPRREVLRLVRAEAGLADRAEQVLEGAVAEEVDALLGEVELHLLSRLLGPAAGSEQGLQVDRVGQLGEVAAVRRVFHRLPTPNIGLRRALPQWMPPRAGFALGRSPTATSGCSSLARASPSSAPGCRTLRKGGSSSS